MVHGDSISREEVFGPVVTVYGVDGPTEAVVRANALPYAFQAAVFAHRWGASTASIFSVRYFPHDRSVVVRAPYRPLLLESALEVAQQLDASAVMINDHTAFRVDW